MARKDKEFLGLDVVSLEDASVLGEVDGLLIDETKNAVAGLILDLGIYEAKVLAYDDVVTVGEDAVMIESASSVRPISQHPILREIADRDIQLSDSLVMNDAGTIIGMVGDFFVDPATGKIKGLEIVTDIDLESVSGSVAVIPIEHVTVGQDLVMVRHGFEEHAARTADDL